MGAEGQALSPPCLASAWPWGITGAASQSCWIGQFNVLSICIALPGKSSAIYKRVTIQIFSSCYKDTLLVKQLEDMGEFKEEDKNHSDPLTPV